MDFINGLLGGAPGTGFHRVKKRPLETCRDVPGQSQLARSRPLKTVGDFSRAGRSALTWTCRRRYPFGIALTYCRYPSPGKWHSAADILCNRRYPP